jgi:hypothetical protein
VKQTVFVIPDYPHAWWRHPEIKVGSLVRLDDYFGRKGDYRVYEVISIWDEGAEVRLHEVRD